MVLAHRRWLTQHLAPVHWSFTTRTCKLGRRRVITDVSLSARRLGLHLPVRSLLIFLAQFAALSWPSLTLGDHMNPLGRTSSDVSWKSLRGAAQRAQPTGGQSPSVEPLDSCLCQGYPTPTTTHAHCSSAFTSPPSKCRLATWSVQTDGLVPNFESLATLTSSSRRGNPRAWAICFHIIRRLRPRGHHRHRALRLRAPVHRHGGWRANVPRHAPRAGARRPQVHLGAAYARQHHRRRPRRRAKASPGKTLERN